MRRVCLELSLSEQCEDNPAFEAEGKVAFCESAFLYCVFDLVNSHFFFNYGTEAKHINASVKMRKAVLLPSFLVTALNKNGLALFLTRVTSKAHMTRLTRNRLHRRTGR